MANEKGKRELNKTRAIFIKTQEPPKVIQTNQQRRQRPDHTFIFIIVPVLFGYLQINEGILYWELFRMHDPTAFMCNEYSFCCYIAIPPYIVGSFYALYSKSWNVFARPLGALTEPRRTYSPNKQCKLSLIHFFLCGNNRHFRKQYFQ